MYSTVASKGFVAKQIAIEHPLESIYPEEILLARNLTIQQVFPLFNLSTEKKRFITIELIDPPKQQVFDFEHGKIALNSIDRKVQVVFICGITKRSYETFLSLRDLKVISYKILPKECQPLLKIEEIVECEQAVKQDPEAQKIFKKRGVPDLDYLMVEPWCAGWYGEESERGKRLMKALVFTRLGPKDNGYAHPLEGLCFCVDLHEMKVLHIEETRTDVPIPKTLRNYSRHFYEQDGIKLRTDLKPIMITQPQGVSFKVDKNKVDWLGWNFRVGFTAREGLVLHNLKYNDRTVLFRASVVEMQVPYGSPDVIHSRKNAFDCGEYGFGALVNSLKRGCDCLGEIFYFDGLTNTSTGEPLIVPNAICLHEEDHGLLWKHTDWRLGETEVRRQRRLVISFFVTVGNYEYGFFWYLYLDGKIQMEVKHSGIVNTNAYKPGDEDELRYASVLNEGLCAQIHQHFYNVRLDWAVDGAKNSLVEANVYPSKAKTNFRKNAFYAENTLLKTEKEARRDIDIPKSRYWKIINKNKKNAVGHPVGYAFMPAMNVTPFSQHDSWNQKRATWLRHHFWCTQFNELERYPSGEHPNQSDGEFGGTGLEHWSDQNRSIDDQDLVVWYTTGITHVVRLEDFPVMLIYPLLAFTLMPEGFMDQNPCLNIPPQEMIYNSNPKVFGNSECCPPKEADMASPKITGLSLAEHVATHSSLPISTTTSISVSPPKDSLVVKGVESSQVFEQIQEAINDKLVSKVGAIFQFNIKGDGAQGSWILDLKNKPGFIRLVSDNQKATVADCTIISDDKTFRDLMSGKTSPEKAFMSGKLKTKGKLEVAMKLTSITKELGSARSKL